MSELLGMSFDAAASPSMTLTSWRGNTDDDAPSGWGFGWYPTDGYASVVIKDPFSTGDTPLSRVLTDWERFRGTVFVCHIRGAAKRVTQQDTHPFCASLGGRHFLLAHNGTLQPGFREELPLADDPLFEPVGRTDSEWALCWLLTQLRGYGCRRLADMGWSRLHKLLERINTVGTTNLLISDGQDLVAYRDADDFNDLHVMRRLPPHDQNLLTSAALSLKTDAALDRHRTFIVFATSPLGDGFRRMVPGEMLVARRGAFVYESHPGQSHPERSDATIAPTAWENQPAMNQPPPVDGPSLHVVSGPAVPQQIQAQGSQTESIEVRSETEAQQRGERDSRDVIGRIMRVVHKTTYTYEQPVELSSHVFRLSPLIDPWQDVLEHHLELSPARAMRSYEDVFGNTARSVKLDNPFTLLSIEATSVVRIRKLPPLASIDRRTSIPLVWMPWQRQMMNPYLLPEELPEVQLRELSKFAMSFVERQDYNLVDTIDDINRTIYRDFSYVSGSTTLTTTPFDVYSNRRGVCQDFANLFICLTRLLGVPARYRVGYIHTGANYDNKIQSEASHAWAEVYLPDIGWRGFDPTNGCKVGLDHIRVASGRNYQDATPTQGTLFKGGTGETLSVDVRVEVVEEE